jgi:hypothetical protein
MPKHYLAIPAHVLILTGLSIACALTLLRAEQKRDAAPRGVSGRVVNAQGQPLEKAVVYLKDTKSLAIRSYITQEDGNFRFNALAPNVDYEIYADYEGARSEVKTLGAFDERTQPVFTLKIKSKH